MTLTHAEKRALKRKNKILGNAGSRMSLALGESKVESAKGVSWEERRGVAAEKVKNVVSDGLLAELEKPLDVKVTDPQVVEGLDDVDEIKNEVVESDKIKEVQILTTDITTCSAHTFFLLCRTLSIAAYALFASYWYTTILGNKWNKLEALVVADESGFDDDEITISLSKESQATSGSHILEEINMSENINLDYLNIPGLILLNLISLIYISRLAYLTDTANVLTGQQKEERNMIYQLLATLAGNKFSKVLTVFQTLKCWMQDMGLFIVIFCLAGTYFEQKQE